MNNYYNALSEVSTILQHLELESLKKIPKNIIEDIEKNKNLEYNYIIDKKRDLNEQEILPETKAILANLYRDFIATDVIKERIKNKEKYEILELEKEKSKKYSNEIMFKSKESNSIAVVEKKESLIKRIKNKILNYIKNLKEYVTR